MATYLNPTVNTSGTAEADTFTFDRPPSGEGSVIIDGREGRDALLFNVPGTGSLRFTVTPIGATYEGKITYTGDYPAVETGITFTSFDVFDLTGSAFGDLFRHVYNPGAAAPTLDFDGAAGSDVLELHYAQSTTGFDFSVRPDGSISSSLGSFANFESFVTYGGIRSDDIRTGDGDDTIVANPRRGLAGPVPDADTVYAGGGNDTVHTNAPGIYDGGDGTDYVGVFYAGMNYQPPLLVEIGSTVTLSNGTTITNFEDFLISTGSDADRFEVRADGNFELRGWNGRDTLVFEVPSDGPQTFKVNAFATMLTGKANNITFSEMEVVFFNGGASDDTLTVTGMFTPDQINLNGAGGVDLLNADFSNTTGDNFIVNPDGGITSDFGFYLSLERFNLVGSSSNNTLTTGERDDTIQGYFGDDTISGGGGADVLRGGEGNDTIYAHSAGGLDSDVDSLFGDAGDDVLYAGAPDSVDGGEGFDTLRIDASSENVTFRLGVDADGTIASNQGSFSSIERFILTLGSANDAVIAGAGDDDLSGGGGDDYLQGAGGNDILRGGSGTNTLIGGTGDDSYYVDSSSDILVEAAGEGFDTVFASMSYTLGQGSNLEALVANGTGLTLAGNELDNTIIGSSGSDILSGGGGADSLDGGTGIDTVSYAGDGGAVFVNLTLGQGYTNTAFGDTYMDIENIVGTDFGDFLIGDTGVNVLDGGGGDDVLVGAIGSDMLIGGDGNDWASFQDNSGTVFVNLTLGLGFNNAAEGDTLTGIENLVGGLFDDFFIGDEQGNRLNGAMGADTLLGAGGADVFMFTYAPGATSTFGSPNVDLILDFHSGEDTIELASGAFAGLAAGALPASAFVLGTAAADGDDRIIYDAATGNLWFDADGSGAQAAMLFATLGETSHPAIAASDFAVV